MTTGADLGDFIAENRPNAEQIHFIEKVVDYLVENGCVNEVRDLMKTPFDRPTKFTALFSQDEQKKIVDIIDKIRKNATIAK